MLLCAVHVCDSLLRLCHYSLCSLFVVVSICCDVCYCDLVGLSLFVFVLFPTVEFVHSLLLVLSNMCVAFAAFVRSALTCLWVVVALLLFLLQYVIVMLNSTDNNDNNV